MRGPADGASLRIVHGVVVNEDGHAENVHSDVTWGKEQDALRSVLTLTDIEDVVFGGNLDPSIVNQEVDTRPSGIARGSDNAAILEGPLGAALNAGHKVGYKGLEVGGRNDHGSGSSIDNTVERVVFPGCVSVKGSPSIAVHI